MKKTTIIAALALSALASTAFAQGDLTVSVGNGTESAVQADNVPAPQFVGKHHSLRALATTPTITVTPVAGVDYNSPSWAGFVDRVMNKAFIDAGYQSTGNWTAGDPATDPTAYTAAIPLHWEYLAARKNNSSGLWMGTNVTSGAFANERGTRTHFMVHIVRGSTRLSFSQLTAAIDEINPANVLDQTGIGYGSSNYSLQARGLNWGADGKPGGGDDSWITSGGSDQQCDEIFFVGVSAAYTADTDGNLGAVKSHVLQNLPFAVAVTYSIGGSSTTYTASTADIPRPTLRIAKSTGNLVALSQTGGAGNSFVVQIALTPNGPWTDTAGVVSDTTAPFQITGIGKQAFFRLIRR